MTKDNLHLDYIENPAKILTFEEACNNLKKIERNRLADKNVKHYDDDFIICKLDNYYKSLINYNNMFSLEENILLNDYQIFKEFINEYHLSFSVTFGSFNASSILYFNKFLGVKYFLTYLSMLYKSIKSFEFNFEKIDTNPKDSVQSFHPSWKNHFYVIYYYHGGRITELKSSFVEKTGEIFDVSTKEDSFIDKVGKKVDKVFINQIVDSFKI